MTTIFSELVDGVWKEMMDHVDDFACTSQDAVVCAVIHLQLG